MHRIKCAGICFALKKSQICQWEAIIVGQKCTPEGHLSENSWIFKIVNWPIPTTAKQVRGFLGLCGIVRNWIKDFSYIARPLSELIQKDIKII